MKNNYYYKILLRLPRLFWGFTLCAIGIRFLITADLGMNPWGTFTAGLVNITGLSFGRLSQLIGLIIIVLTLPIKSFPGIGTILNMIFIGFFIDLFAHLPFMVTPDHFILKLVMCFVGLIILSYGIYMYLSCGLGAGPRDGLMIALIKITRSNATVIKPAIEITVTVIGIILGGPLGIGTFIVALLGGKFLDYFFFRFQYDPKINKQDTLVDFFNKGLKVTS